MRSAVASATGSGSWGAAAMGLEELRKHGANINAQADAVLAALRRASGHGRTCRAATRFEKLFVNDSLRRNAVSRLRLEHVFSLLQAGELAEAQACLDPVALASTDPDVRLLDLTRIHLAALQALNAHSPAGLHKALKRYEVYLRAGTAPKKHLALISDIAADGYAFSKARPVADSLVLEFLGG